IRLQAVSIGGHDRLQPETTHRSPFETPSRAACGRFVIGTDSFRLRVDGKRVSELPTHFERLAMSRVRSTLIVAVLAGISVGLGAPTADAQQKPKEVMWTHAFDLSC